MSIAAGLQRLRDAAAEGRLDDLGDRYGLALLSVFGSAVVGDRPRDLDIAYAARAGVRVDVLALLDELVALTGVEDIDLLDLDRADPVATERGLVPAIGLYESTAGLFASRQMAAVLERMDTDWLRRLDLELLAR